MKFKPSLFATTALIIAMCNIFVAPSQAVSKYSITCTSPGFVEVAKPGIAKYASLSFKVNGAFGSYTLWYLLTDYPNGYPTQNGATKVIVKLDDDESHTSYLYGAGIGCR